MFSHELIYFLMILVFVLGYSLITIEHYTKINKAAISLLMAVLCWGLHFADQTLHPLDHASSLLAHLGDISQIIFFLLGALTIVETINVHQGFNLISKMIKAQSKRKALWIISGVAFFLSSVLDNLTTTIVVISLLQKIIEDKEDRWLMGGAVVIAANAGGAWTPIGDVTTTMLWIGGQVTTQEVMKKLFVPSLISAIIPLACLTFFLKGTLAKKQEPGGLLKEPSSSLIFILGVCSLIAVPFIKVWTGLPPYMGMLFAVGALWLVTDKIHCSYPERKHLRLPEVLAKIDLSSTLFFLGILLCVNSLESEKILLDLSLLFDSYIGNSSYIALAIGLASAVIDNVPLVAASTAMYQMNQFPVDSIFWHLIAYCAGTGGSILVIGSAAGVVFMGLEEVDFFWYLKRISLPALLGYIAGFIVYFFI
ncbi:MAG: sodium:proton antiporter NhaD [Parachlamydiaceae bacterium]